MFFFLGKDPPKKPWEFLFVCFTHVTFKEVLPHVYVASHSLVLQTFCLAFHMGSKPSKNEFFFRISEKKHHRKPPKNPWKPGFSFISAFFGRRSRTAAARPPRSPHALGRAAPRGSRGPAARPRGSRGPRRPTRWGGVFWGWFFL